MPRSRLAVIIAAVAAGFVLLILVIVVVLAPQLRPAPEPQSKLSYAIPVAPVPISANAGNGVIANSPDPTWLAETSSATGIPPRVLAAYGGASIAMVTEHPYCNLSWITLAGVGRIESRHGAANGSSIDDNGDATVPIVGPELVGEGFNPQDDTDGGELDGDTVGDRAVGPMQFLPSTWSTYRSDGNQDGVFDPQNIDDAVIAAARYLCIAGDGDQNDRDVWRSAVSSYNASDIYIADVAAAANEYAAAAGQPRWSYSPRAPLTR